MKSGIETELLTLEWPPNIVSSELSDFETQARRLRYQALAKACRTRSIQTLLLGHHDDDQAETVLMRLAQGHRDLGLRGILPVSDIPECHGMYRINQSGQPLRVKDRGGITGRLGGLQYGLRGIERGGIHICRPLLSFSKDQLTATCEAKGMRWFEDATNQERTLTMRNAVRYLMRSNLLPFALHKESLLKVAAKINGRVIARDGGALKKFEKTIFQLDVRTGRLIIHHLPNLFLQGINKTPPQWFEAARRGYRYLAARLLQHLVSLVTPQESVPLRDLERAVTMTFPRLGESKIDDDLHEQTFTIAGVQCSQVVDAQGSEEVKMSWVLKRQPMTSLEYQKWTIKPPLESDHTGPTRASNVKTSSWILWDGRYWIRLAGPELEKYQIRPFEERDLAEYTKNFASFYQQRLLKTLRHGSERKLKWTLPAIARLKEQKDGDVVTERSKVVALPSLGSKLSKESIRWQIHYKHIDLGKRELDVLDPPFDLVPIQKKYRPNRDRGTTGG